jgi:hypothetical protein
MKLVKTLVAAAALAASLGANAAVNGALGGGFGTFLTLAGSGAPNSGGTLSGAVSGTITGGSVLDGDSPPFADDVAPGSKYLTAGPFAGSPATLTFAGAGVDYISFLWGSPDVFNSLTVNSTGSSPQVFTAAILGFPATGNQDQAFNQSVQFTALAGSKITSLVFTSSDNAFESANFSITPIPEPETYALMMAGLGVMGFVARRRRKG